MSQLRLAKQHLGLKKVLLGKKNVYFAFLDTHHNLLLTRKKTLLLFAFEGRRSFFLFVCLQNHEGLLVREI